MQRRRGENNSRACSLFWGKKDIIWTTFEYFLALLLNRFAIVTFLSVP